MARTLKDVEADLKKANAAAVASHKKMMAAIEKFFDGTKIKLSVQIKALDKALRDVEGIKKNWKQLVKEYLIEKGVPKDTLGKMLTKYYAKFNREVMPLIVDLQNKLKEIERLNQEKKDLK